MLDYAGFADAFRDASDKAGKPKQYLVPYYIASHPGSDLDAMIDLALFLKRNGYRPDQVQDFIPAPFDIATCMYHTGLDPFTGEEVYTAKHLRDRKLQRALLQFFKPENYFEVREALQKAGRQDLIGSGCDALIPANPPKVALQARMEKANKSLAEGKYVHTIPGEAAKPEAMPTPAPAGEGSAGYRPHRQTADCRAQAEMNRRLLQDPRPDPLPIRHPRPMSPPKRTPNRFGGKPKARRRPEAKAGGSPPPLAHPGPKPSSRPGYRPSVILPSSQGPMPSPPPGRGPTPAPRSIARPAPRPWAAGRSWSRGSAAVANVVSIDKLAGSASRSPCGRAGRVFEETAGPIARSPSPSGHRRDLAAPDHRFIARAVFALFRWRGWIDTLHLERPEARLLIWPACSTSPAVHPACRVWARLLAKTPTASSPSAMPPTGPPEAKAGSGSTRAGIVSADPWRLFPDWLRDHLPLPPGGGPPKMKYLEFLPRSRPAPRSGSAPRGGRAENSGTELAELGLKPWVHRKLTRAAKLEPEADVHHQPAFERGDLEIQDLASQAVALACDPDPGERWWDACAGAGGKALHLAALMKGKGLVVASDVHEGRLKEAVRRARRSPFRNLTTKVWDGKHVVGKAGKYDGVLVDAPCSAIGTWRRNPDARWTLGSEAVDRLAELQAQILRSAAAGVRPGGTLVYSVCTITLKETQGVLRPFLADHPEFHLDPFPHPLTAEGTDGTLVIWPQESDTDGMFIARMVRTAPKPAADPKPKAKRPPAEPVASRDTPVEEPEARATPAEEPEAGATPSEEPEARDSQTEAPEDSPAHTPGPSDAAE